MATFKVYQGSEKPFTAVGKNQCHLLMFAIEHPCWHYAGSDRATKRALKGLERRGSIVINKCGQFAPAYPKFINELYGD